MSAWLDGPLAGPLVEGELCAAAAGYRCEEPAEVIARDLRGGEVPLCEFHADRHGLLRVA